VSELGVKDKDRKNSMLLPARDREMDSKIGGSSLAAAGSNVIGGEQNYKRFQMLVTSSMGTGHDVGGYKRSNSMINTSGKYAPPRRTVTMNDNNRKKTLKLG
jgi:hypothetical protein